MTSTKNKPIFTITTLRDPDQKHPGGSPRCVGFYYKYLDAVIEVENNSCDIYEEGYYPYCVIEEITQGIYPFPREYWFKWCKKANRYARIKKKPQVFNQIVCFGLG